MKYTLVFSIFTVLVFTLTVFLLKRLIPVLASRHIGQKILDIGPRWHKDKEGTPTMGGLSFIFAGIICFIVFGIVFFPKMDRRESLTLVNIGVYGILNAMIGMIDDVAKMRKRRNEGLTPVMKLILQSVFTFVFLLTMNMSVGIDTVLTVPFFNVSFDLGIVYYGILFVFLIGIVNSVNLTDGIDGLASAVTFTVGLLLLCVCIFVSGSYTVSFVSALLIGSSLGFLVYNFYPARVFMGDTGSLFLGGAVVGTAFVIDEPIIVFIIGGMYVLEAVSVILQVGCFKLTSKRIFKMAPIHHHFEKCGWKENKIVIVFSALTVALCVIAWFGL